MNEQAQIEYLGNQLSDVEARMIDPKEFGQLQSEVESLRRDLDRIVQSMESMTSALRVIQTQLAEARGGWKVMMAVGGGSAAVGAMIGKFLTTFGGKPPGM